MSTSVDELMQDQWRVQHGYQEEVQCGDCGEVWFARFWEGDPGHSDALNCHCGGRGEPR